MTLDALIAQLQDLRAARSENGTLPVVMEPGSWDQATHRDGIAVAMVVPCSEGGGPETDPDVPLISVQLASYP